jgi:hypothetical protein
MMEPRSVMGSKVHIAVNTLGHLLGLQITPTNEGDRAQVATLSKAVQETNGQSGQAAFADQDYTGDDAAEAAEAAEKEGIQLEVVKLAEAKRGFVLL